MTRKKKLFNLSFITNKFNTWRCIQIIFLLLYHKLLEHYQQDIYFETQFWESKNIWQLSYHVWELYSQQAGKQIKIIESMLSCIYHQKFIIKKNVFKSSFSNEVCTSTFMLSQLIDGWEIATTKISSVSSNLTLLKKKKNKVLNIV